MSRKRAVWSVVGAVAVVVLAAATLVTVGFLGGDEPAEAALTSASRPPAADGSTSDAASASGTWTVDTTAGSLDDGSVSFAGYRIQEEVVGIGANTAVGRTRSVGGTLEIESTSIASLSVEVDMTTLTSDDDRRDDQLRLRGLETSAYPTATFELTERISFDRAPSQGDTVTADATGDLTLHGVTRQVTVPVEARWNGDTIEVVTGFDVDLADYRIEPPTGFLVLSIADTGTVELHLLFTRA